MIDLLGRLLVPDGRGLHRCTRVNTVLLLDGVRSGLLSLIDLVSNVLLLLVDVEEGGHLLQIVEVHTGELLLQLLQQIWLLLLNWVVFAGEI